MKHIAVIDIGSQTIKTAVAKINGRDKSLQILAIQEIETDGIRKGAVTDINETANSISKVLETLSSVADTRIREAFIGVSDPQINLRQSEGMIIISRADSEVTEEDIKRAYQASETSNVSQNREIIHTIAKDFSVDDEMNIKNPIGMRGLKLKMNALIIEGLLPSMKNVRKVVELAGVNSSGLIFSPLASARAVLTKKQKELGVILLDIGATISTLLVYKDGEVVHGRVLDIGSANITNDIAINLKIQIEIAEKLKIEYGSALPHLVSKKEIVDFESLGISDLKMSRKALAVIINKRLKEFSKILSKELAKIDKNFKVPGGIVITGGGSKLPLMENFFKKELKLPAQIGIPDKIEGFIDKANDPAYASLIGLLLLGGDDLNIEAGGFSQRFLHSSSDESRGFWGRLFKNFLP
ncbi:MAG: cell division protein FtsA [Candidatus Staskawiczbacteria bacterium]|nr:cell division protein FtsA [Candidatus Staskawiczbacteria bacterium]